MAQQKYIIIEKIDAGGMAEVWKGKATSLRGFEKMVAIKRVLPNLAKNKKFISMFLDEARLALYLNHANVVQTFDIGVSDHAYFIVMEWMDGVNLKSILETSVKRGWRVPKEQVIYTGIEICKGLSHAHNRRDPDGRPLNIVHRDISPPNVLLSREGEVKLVDFGLAKAASQLTQTDPGVVKGKFSYLSPEATQGKAVDYRADIFATGIVVWEALSGRQLFDGETDMKTVEAVRAAEIPSIRRFNTDVEPELEKIVNRALTKDPRDRYQSSEEFGHELAKYLFENRLLVTSYDIGMLVKRVMSQRVEPEIAPKHSSGVATVQAEIFNFNSVEDLDKLEFVSVAESNENREEIRPDAIDPRGWAAEMGVIDGDETIIDVPPSEQELLKAAAATGSAQPVADRGASKGGRPPPPLPGRAPPSSPSSSREVNIDAPDDDDIPALPAVEPRQRRIVEPIGPAPTPRERQARADAAASAARRAQAPAGADHSVVFGVALGVLGALIIGGAIWFFLGR